MTALWVAALVAFLVSVDGQQYGNGFINPLFLQRSPQGRSGRVYDPWTNDLRDNGYYLSRGGGLRAQDNYRDRGLPYDSRFDERRYQSRYDDQRRFPNRYDDYQRYQSRYDDVRRNPAGYDDYRRISVPVDTDRRFDVYRQYPEDVRYLQTVGLATTVRPDDRIQGIDRGQILSTSSPDLAVTVQPNASARK